MSDHINRPDYDQELFNLQAELEALDVRILKIRVSRKDENAKAQRQELLDERQDLLENMELVIQHQGKPRRAAVLFKKSATEMSPDKVTIEEELLYTLNGKSQEGPYNNILGNFFGKKQTRLGVFGTKGSKDEIRKQQLNSSNHLKQLLSASNQRQVPISDLMKILFLALLVLSAAIQLVHAFPHKPDHAEDGTYSAPAVDDNNLNMVFLHLELTGVAAYHSNDTNRNTWTRVYEVVLDSGNGDIQRSVFWLPSLESFVAIVEHEWRKEKSYHFSKDGITWVETGRYPYDPKDIVSEEQLVEAYGQTFLARINYDKQSVETLADELTWVVKWNFTVNSTPCKPDPIRGTCVTTQMTSLGPYGVMFVIMDGDHRMAYISQNGEDLVEFNFPRDPDNDSIYPLAFNYLPTYDRVLFHHRDYYLMDKDMQLKQVNFRADSESDGDELGAAEAKFIECDGQMWALGHPEYDYPPKFNLYNSVDGLKWVPVSTPVSGSGRGQIACVDNGRLAIANYGLYFSVGTASQGLGWVEVAIKQ
ncbi:hypothetical protein PROFUN_16267 [Planoprotostelium fungivorum]|uniref:Uncharacterized protein n=1 Tax=Planoprotostelium fungivorum TaxID=1890364 RepID=A0A2P6MRN1_9EUKA|nr:hypothetical protein PROFUN_16267 [Planoprotostelium fungivorum]